MKKRGLGEADDCPKPCGPSVAQLGLMPVLSTKSRALPTTSSLSLKENSVAVLKC